MAAEVEDLREIPERFTLPVQIVGALVDRNRLTGKLLRFREPAAPGLDTRLYLPPECLGRGVVLVPELTPELCKRFCFVVAS